MSKTVTIEGFASYIEDDGISIFVILGPAGSMESIDIADWLVEQLGLPDEPSEAKHIRVTAEAFDS